MGKMIEVKTVEGMFGPDQTKKRIKIVRGEKQFIVQLYINDKLALEMPEGEWERLMR